MTGAAQVFTIGRLAHAAGVKIDTVRFYERQGLLARAPRSGGGYRLYGQADAERLRFIRRAKALGFSLEDIAELLHLARDGQDRSLVKAVAARRVADLERRIQEMEAMRTVLAHHLLHCSGRGPVQGCPIIAALTAEPPERPALKPPPPRRSRLRPAAGTDSHSASWASSRRIRPAGR